MLQCIQTRIGMGMYAASVFQARSAHMQQLHRVDFQAACGCSACGSGTIICYFYGQGNASYTPNLPPSNPSITPSRHLSFYDHVSFLSLLISQCFSFAVFVSFMAAIKSISWINKYCQVYLRIFTTIFQNELFYVAVDKYRYIHIQFRRVNRKEQARW
jgi:hypothetical protein